MPPRLRLRLRRPRAPPPPTEANGYDSFVLVTASGSDSGSVGSGSSEPELPAAPEEYPFSDSDSEVSSVASWVESEAPPEDQTFQSPSNFYPGDRRVLYWREGVNCGVGLPAMTHSDEEESDTDCDSFCGYCSHDLACRCGCRRRVSCWGLSDIEEEDQAPEDEDEVNTEKSHKDQALSLQTANVEFKLDTKTGDDDDPIGLKDNLVYYLTANAGIEYVSQFTQLASGTFDDNDPLAFSASPPPNLSSSSPESSAAAPDQHPSEYLDDLYDNVSEATHGALDDQTSTIDASPPQTPIRDTSAFHWDSPAEPRVPLRNPLHTPEDPESALDYDDFVQTSPASGLRRKVASLQLRKKVAIGLEQRSRKRSIHRSTSL